MTTKRAATALQRAGIPDTPSALRALVIYAAQNPGFEFGNYWSGDHSASVRAYRSDYRMALKAWDDVRVNARICASVGVTDDDIIKACESAFSGRLSIERQPTNTGTIGGYRIDYCTGQYWPTEYRRAVASVLDYASTLAYRRGSFACSKMVSDMVAENNAKAE